MEGILKSGIVGYGYMGQIRKRVVEDHPDLQLIDVCEAKDEIRKKRDKR